MSDERDWRREADALLHQWFERIVLSRGHVGSLRIDPPLAEDESKWFLEGLEAGLFLVDDEGYFQTVMLPAARQTGDRQRTLQLFNHFGPEVEGGPVRRRLAREVLCQLSAASGLILEQGWGREQVHIEPSKSLLGLRAPNAIDILVTDLSTNSALVGVEVKKSRRDLNHLRDDMVKCGGQSPHEKDACVLKRRSNHAKSAFLRATRTPWFWAVSPHDHQLFRVHYEDDRLSLETADGFPSPVRIYERR